MFLQILILSSCLMSLASSVRVIDVPLQQKKNKHDIDLTKYCPYMKQCGEWSHFLCAFNPNVMEKYGPGCAISEPTGYMSRSMRKRLLVMINVIRSRVARGIETGKFNTVFPRAYGMLKVKWDHELAKIADIRARQCGITVDYCLATSNFDDVFLLSTSGYRLDKFNYTRTSDGLMNFILTSVVLDTWYAIKYKIEDPSVTPYYTRYWEVSYQEIVHSKLSHMGCGLTTFHAYVQELYNTPIIVCLFSQAIQTGQPVYDTERPPGSSAKCGCPPGTREEKKSCLCIQDPCLTMACERSVIVLPIVRAQDVNPDQLAGKNGTLVPDADRRNFNNIRRSLKSSTESTEESDISSQKEISSLDEELELDDSEEDENDLDESESIEDDINLKIANWEVAAIEDIGAKNKLEAMKHIFEDLTRSESAKNEYTDITRKSINNKQEVSKLFPKEEFKTKKLEVEIDKNFDTEFANKEIKEEILPIYHGDNDNDKDTLIELPDNIEQLPDSRKTFNEETKCINNISNDNCYNKGKIFDKDLIEKKSTYEVNDDKNQQRKLLKVDQNKNPSKLNNRIQTMTSKSNKVGKNNKSDILNEIRKVYLNKNIGESVNKMVTKRTNKEIDKLITNDIKEIFQQDYSNEKTAKQNRMLMTKENIEANDNNNNKTEVLNDIIEMYLNEKTAKSNIDDKSMNIKSNNDEEDDTSNNRTYILNDDIKNHLNKNSDKSSRMKKASSELQDNLEKQLDQMETEIEQFRRMRINKKEVVEKQLSKLYDKLNPSTKLKENSNKKNTNLIDKNPYYMHSLLDVHSSSPENNLKKEEDLQFMTKKELLDALNIAKQLRKPKKVDETKQLNININLKNDEPKNNKKTLNNNLKFKNQKYDKNKIEEIENYELNNEDENGMHFLSILSGASKASKRRSELPEDLPAETSDVKIGSSSDEILKIPIFKRRTAAQSKDNTNTLEKNSETGEVGVGKLRKKYYQRKIEELRKKLNAGTDLD